MNNNIEITKEKIERLYNKLKNEGESSGYHLNPDEDFTKELMKGLLINQERYGYMACPCRLASGEKSKDIDIICPCDYRDPDLDEFETCYCSLYVTKNIIDKKKELSSIPERRSKNNKKKEIKQTIGKNLVLSKPVWRCKVCGYLCGRDNPPESCPICKVKKDRFELFIK
jgi:ferredoxin-thioredoxin reductase catalytic subunit